MKTTLTRRQFLTAAALLPLAGAVSCRSSKDARRGASRPPARFFFTSQGKTAVMNADGTGLRWFEFNEPNQVTWQPFGFLSDGRVLFLSMEQRRDGPGKPFEEYYHQTPTHIWIHDLDKGTLTEVANRDRLSAFYGGGPLLNDTRFIMQVVRQNNTQLYSMNLDGTDAKEFTHAGEGFPYGLSVSPDGKRVAFHLATSSGYQAWVSDADGGNRVKVAANPEHLYFGPSWSRDGEWLFFHDCLHHQDPGHDWADVYLCRPDGSEARLLTKGQGAWFGTSYGNPENRGGGSETIYWTHDGRLLCSLRLPGSKVAWEFQPQRPDTDHFNRDYKPELARGGTEICKINPRDGSVTSITRPGEGVWDFRAAESPDGKQIVFCRAKTGESPAIWMMNSDGTNQRLLTKGLDNRGADHPRWVPQGKL
jgi:TolB protein